MGLFSRKPIRKVLLAHGDAQTAVQMSASLKKAGFAVDVAINPDLAIQAMVNDPYFVLIIQQDFGGESTDQGGGFIKTIRELNLPHVAQTDQIPIVRIVDGNEVGTVPCAYLPLVDYTRNHHVDIDHLLKMDMVSWC